MFHVTYAKFSSCIFWSELVECWMTIVRNWNESWLNVLSCNFPDIPFIHHSFSSRCLTAMENMCPRTAVWEGPCPPTAQTPKRNVSYEDHPHLHSYNWGSGAANDSASPSLNDPLMPSQTTPQECINWFPVCYILMYCVYIGSLLVSLRSSDPLFLQLCFSSWAFNNSS